jgi:hypothetical protein
MKKFKKELPQLEIVKIKAKQKIIKNSKPVKSKQKTAKSKQKSGESNYKSAKFKQYKKEFFVWISRIFERIWEIQT